MNNARTASAHPPRGRLTRDIPGIGGRIKAGPDDFRVEEIPLYEPSGTGDHLYIRIEKRGMTTHEAVGRIARHLRVRPRDIGYAGIKDAAAVTVQTLSVEHVDAAQVQTFRDDRVRILAVDRHTNKLRPGHLSMNRFSIRIRGADTARGADAEKILGILSSRGVPNFFGPQRFGIRGDTADLGAALVRGDHAGFLSCYLGEPRAGDPPARRAAREAFDAGDPDAALSRWPASCRDRRRVLQAFRRNGDAARACGTVNRRMRRLFVSAFQSALFNAVLLRRLDTIDRLIPGDIAKKCDTGGVFRVEDPAAEQPRADRFEISPTGPLPGYRCLIAEREAGAIEQAVFDERGVDPAALKKAGSLKITGTRRPLRFPLHEPRLETGADAGGAYAAVSFGAPPGCYATVVTDELIKENDT